MAEYIEKEELLRKRPFCVAGGLVNDYTEGFCDCVDEARETIKNMPAADVVPVVHGRWVSRVNPQWPAHRHDACSVCGWWNTKNALCYDGNHKPGHSLNYCPNCGAKMDGEEQDDE